MSKVTYKEVWDTLSKIDVSDKSEKKGGLTYLSWAWAWGKLMEHYPQATFQFTLHEKADGSMTDVLEYSDGSASVECVVRIDDLQRTMWLPVMDYKNSAIPNPNARAISDNKMRCLTKCIGMFGLGHYIYAGEDLPQENTGSVGTSADKKRDALIWIRETRNSDVFKKDPKALDAIEKFLNNIDDNTPLDAIKNFQKRMKEAIKKEKK